MHELVSFAIVAGIITVTPGLDTFLVLRSALRFGIRSGLLASAGISAGLVVWALASGAGIAALLVASQEAFTVLRVAGALYLAYVGLKSIWGGIRGTRHLADEVPITSQQGWQAFRVGLFNNLLNPKIGVFYLTIFPQFIPDNGNALLWSGALALIHVVEGLIWLIAIALFAARFRPLLRKPVVTRVLDMVSGVVFLLFGARVARDIRA